MARYIVKFGGTSLANTDRIQHAAGIVVEYVNAGHEVAVVVSAMAGITNQLIGYANTLSINVFDAFDTNARDEQLSECDVVTASGEQITAGLMALALQKSGLNAQSFLAWQIAIETDDNHGDAHITHIATDQLEDCFARGIIPVVAGFQGLTTHNRVTTLGRGGSDTTAVVLAAALDANSCYIYTDVEGVYTADPRIVPNARKIDVISYPEMLEFAMQGAKVLHTRSVELGMLHEVDIHVLSSFVRATGTRIIVGEATDQINGITHSLNDVHVRITGASELTCVLDVLNQANICLDTVMHVVNPDYSASLDFTFKKSDLVQAKSILSGLKVSYGFDTLAIDLNIVKISIIGVGVRRDQTIESRVLSVLKAHQISVQLASCSDVKLSLVIAHDQMTKAMGVLHDTLIINEKENTELRDLNDHKCR
ncbi:MAG: aspartate kinase [Pseudomonadota bacterium]